MNKITRKIEKKTALEMRYSDDVLRYIMKHPKCIRMELRKNVVSNGNSLRDTLDALYKEGLITIIGWREEKGEALYHCLTTETGTRIGGLYSLIHELNNGGGSFETRLAVDRLLRDVYGEKYDEALELAKNPPSGVKYIGPDDGFE